MFILTFAVLFKLDSDYPMVFKIMLKEKICNSIRIRKKNGFIRRSIIESFRLWLDEHTVYALFALFYHITTFCFGSTIAYSVIVKSAYKFHILPCKVSPMKKLWHLSPVENINSILNEGLRSKEGNKVFLTDDAEFILSTGFIEWKQKTMGKTIEFCLLKINVESSDVPTNMETNGFWMHEFLIEYVPPEFITLIAEDDIKMTS